MKNIVYKILLLIISSIFFSSCSQKNSLDIDLSDLPKPKNNTITDTLEKDIDYDDNQLLIKDLISFENNEKLLSKYKFGKKDPFSKNENKLNSFSSNFKLTGFLNTEIEKYVFVSYLGNKGSISENSVGGLNTNLLPNGAQVINIDPKKGRLKISFDNEHYIFEL